ncbi:hypothetical protein HDV05_004226 [Chytridiales sp. JEL 0842]|nr:hypothetical protein HDV05_004226 [Chytridiales sp. JEL 0842]
MTVDDIDDDDDVVSSVVEDLAEKTVHVNHTIADDPARSTQIHVEPSCRCGWKTSVASDRRRFIAVRKFHTGDDSDVERPPPFIFKGPGGRSGFVDTSNAAE